MSDMADVLAKHQDLAWNYEKGKAVCGGCDETLGPMTAYIEKQYTWLVTHQAAALSAAGFGLVADAKAEALEEAADVLAKLQYVRPDQPGREEYERMLAIRRGETDLWLYTRARTLKAAS